MPFGCKCVVVAIREGIGYLAAGDIPANKPSLASVLLRVARVCICAMNSFFYFMDCVRVSASYRSFLAFAFCCFVFLSFGRFYLVFVFNLSLVLLCRCSSDIFFLSSRPRTVPVWQPRILQDMVEARSVNVKNTHTHTHPRSPFARPGACTRALYGGGNRVRGTGRSEGDRGRVRSRRRERGDGNEIGDGNRDDVNRLFVL